MNQLVVFGFVLDWVANWLTPIWLLSVGAAAGLAGVIVIALLAKILGPLFGNWGKRNAVEFGIGVREGVLWPLLVLCISMSVFAVVGAFMVRDPGEKLASLKRIPYSQDFRETFDIEPAATDDDGVLLDKQEQPVEVNFLRSEISRLAFSSDQNLTVSASAPGDEERVLFNVTADEEYVWTKSSQSIAPFPTDEVTKFYVHNTNSSEASLTVHYKTAPPDPEVTLIVWTALSVVLVFLIYMLQRSLMPKLSAIALSTYKSEIAQPLFMIILVLGSFFLIMFIWIPYNTFGEDIKVLKDSGLTLIMVLCIIQAVWGASTSVADEIEGRTALTVLSKPIGRPSFVVGKFLGIAWTVFLMFVIFGLVFLVVVAYKPLYDARESADSAPVWQMSHLEMVRTIPGLVLAFMETLVLAALSVAISTRLPMVPNFVICFAIYVLGHLTPLLVQSTAEGFEPVKFFAELLATVFPNLDHFNIQAVVASGAEVPGIYLATTMVYCSIYTVIAMLLALLMFQDRDVA